MGKEEDDAAKECLGTVPPDPRFQNQNQTWHCWSAFVDYHKCLQLLGDSHQPCEMFQRVFRAICPNAWIVKWQEQLEAGTFAAVMPNEKHQRTGRHYKNPE